MIAKMALFKNWQMINDCEQQIIDSFWAVVKSPSNNEGIKCVCTAFYVFHVCTRREFADLMFHHSLARRTKRDRGDCWTTIDFQADLHGAFIQMYRIWAKGFIDFHNDQQSTADMGLYVVVFKPNQYKLHAKLADGSMEHKDHSSMIHSLSCHDTIYKLDKMELDSMIVCHL